MGPDRASGTEPRADATTRDAVLDGRLWLTQPRRGHRIGHDAILLAAASGGRRGEHAVELGAGVGAAGLALAQRIAGLTMTLVEIDPDLAALAVRNAADNRLADRVRVAALDVAAPAAAYATAGLGPGDASRVLMNPPFNDSGRQQGSPHPGRRLAHIADPDAVLTAWVAAARRLLRAGGVMTLIWRAEGLPSVLAALGPSFGAVAVLPVYPRPEKPAIRVLVRAVKGGRAPLAILPGLTLTTAEGRPDPAAEHVLRGRAVLPLAGDAVD